jgi:hypothetical protein
MRTFPHFNPAGDSLCPICGTNEDKETVLIPIQGTGDGNIYEAIQVHAECIEQNWVYLPEPRIIVINPFFASRLLPRIPAPK